MVDIEHSNHEWWKEQLEQHRKEQMESIFVAILSGSLETVRTTIKSGINVNLPIHCVMEVYPLQLACKKSSSELKKETSSQLIELLLSAKADVNLGHYSPLEELCDQTQPDLQLIQRIVESKATITDKVKNYNAFYWLFKHGTQAHLCVAEYLMKHTSIWKLNVTLTLLFFLCLFHFC